ncbi:unnamed protein product, partial [Meganyctiphanes norvegica]
LVDSVDIAVDVSGYRGDVTSINRSYGTNACHEGVLTNPDCSKSFGCMIRQSKDSSGLNNAEGFTTPQALSLLVLLLDFFDTLFLSLDAFKPSIVLGLPTDLDIFLVSLDMLIGFSIDCILLLHGIPSNWQLSLCDPFSSISWLIGFRGIIFCLTLHCLIPRRLSTEEFEIILQESWSSFTSLLLPKLVSFELYPDDVKFSRYLLVSSVS